MSNQDQERLKRARAFDQETLVAIYDDYHQPLYRYVYRQTGDVEVARDLTAKLFEEFLEALSNGRGPDRHLSSWLYRAAHHIVVDYYRRQKHRRHLPLEEEIIPSDHDPARIVEDRLSVTEARAALQQLTPDQQQVISLRFLEGLPSKEVAARLDKSLAAVKALQHRGLAAMQRYMEQMEREKLSS